MLRSFRFAEADRVLHLYTRDRGRVGAVAKGVRKTKSRFGARLEPLSHVELLLHQGSGELHTVTGASLVDPHRPAREDPYRLSVGLVGAEAMLRLFVEEERNDRAFEALARFLAAVDAIPGGSRGRAALDPLALGFQLKLLWLSGYVPHLESCVECGEDAELVGYLPRAGGAVCAACAHRDGAARPRATAGSTVSCGARSRTPTASGSGSGQCVTRSRSSSLPTSSTGLPATDPDRVKRDLGNGYELDDDPERIDREEVHRYLSEESYWAKGRSREVQDALVDGAARVVGSTTRGARSASRAPSRMDTHSRTSPMSTSSRSTVAGARRRARPLQRRRGAARRDEVVPAYGRRPRPVPEVRLRRAGRARARALEPLVRS